MIRPTDRSRSSQPSKSGRFFQIRGPMAAFARVAIMAALGILVWLPSDATAQQRPGVALEGSPGWAGFVDNSTKDHRVVGGGARFYLTPRLALGPEVVYMRGPNTDRDLMLTGNLTFDLGRSGAAGPPRLNPFLVAGGGLFRHTDDFNGVAFTSTEAAFTAGGGLRVFLTDRVYIAPEVRIGWELHLRTSISVGFQF